MTYNKLRTIYNSDAVHDQKSSVKFSKNRHKTVGGDAHTSYQLSIHFDSTNALKTDLGE